METTNINVPVNTNSITVPTKVKIVASNPLVKYNQNDISKFVGITCTVTHIGTHIGTNTSIGNNDVIVDFIDPTDNKKVSMLLNGNEYEVI